MKKHRPSRISTVIFHTVRILIRLLTDFTEDTCCPTQVTRQYLTALTIVDVAIPVVLCD